MAAKTLTTDILIVGGGIIGLSIARALSRLPNRPSITLIDKDGGLGNHSSTLNSGVLHSGIYYTPGSFKARHCIQGNKMLTQYCLENKLPLLQCGKLIVAKNEQEVSKIHELHEKGKKNGATLELVDESQARQIEPHLSKGLKYPMIWSPSTSVGNPKRVFEQLQEDVRSMDNVKIITNEGYKSVVNSSEGEVIIKTTKDRVITTPKFINCAGLYADRIARDFNEGLNYTLIPLKGLYMVDKTPYKDYGLKTLVYPVPPLKNNNFLGVHTTLTTDGKLKLGPTAVPVFWREHYHGLGNFKFDEFREIITQYIRIGFSSKALLYLQLLVNEGRKYYLPNIIKEGQKLIDVYDEIEKEARHNFKQGNSAIRSQLLNKDDLSFVNDFTIIDRRSHVHFLNIASPGWTSALAMAEDLKKAVEENTEFK